MASKKIRKRAYIPPSSEVVNRRERTETTRTQRSSPTPRGGAGAARELPVPSWGRTLRRLPIYFVMIFALQYLLGSEASKGVDTGRRIMYAASSAAFVTVLFAPFMHMMDRFAYNRIQRKIGGQSAAKPAARSSSKD